VTTTIATPTGAQVTTTTNATTASASGLDFMDPIILGGGGGGAALLLILVVCCVVCKLRKRSRAARNKKEGAPFMEPDEAEGEKNNGGECQLQLSKELSSVCAGAESVAIVCDGVGSEELMAAKRSVGRYASETAEGMAQEAGLSFTRQITEKRTSKVSLGLSSIPQAVFYEEWLSEFGIPEDLPGHRLPLLQPNRESKGSDVLFRPLEASEKGQGRLSSHTSSTAGHLRSPSQAASSSSQPRSSGAPRQSWEKAGLCSPLMVQRHSLQKRQQCDEWLSEMSIPEDLPEYFLPMLQSNRAPKRENSLLIPPWRAPRLL